MALSPHTMKILVVGKGGREHALLKTLAASPSSPELYCFPGSDAIFEIAKTVDASDLPSLIAWMITNEVDLCVAGEESYLVKDEGLANLCAQNNIPCWGPNKHAAQLEASKNFAKEFMFRHDIPTGSSQLVHSFEQGITAIDGKYPTVLKFDGLAAGKGVAVCPDAETASAFLSEVFEERRFGEGSLLVEEFLEGPEVSIFAAVSGPESFIFTPARDYKRALDNDQGPNTGGMGAVASRQILSPELMEQIDQEIIQPTIEGMEKDEFNYRGFLYFGLMLTKDGPKIIEYNCRFGDPECQAVMPLVSGDFAQFCLGGAEGKLDASTLNFSDQWSVCVILASHSYPTGSRSGDTLFGIDNVSDTAQVYHAGTKLNENDEWVTNGGRVLAVVSQGDTRLNAVTTAHKEADKVTFDGAQRRKDIGILNF